MYGYGLLVKFSLRGWQFYLASVQMSEPARKKRKRGVCKKNENRPFRFSRLRHSQ